jgi:tetratricopeptide (TPR) repeat protein
MLKKALFLLLVFILTPGISHAEIKTYIHTVKQSFGGSQSPDDARVGAIAKAKREVLEKAGTYLESLTIVRENVVEKDEILALAAGVLKAEIVSQKNFATEDTFGIVVKAKVDVDTSILEERIRKLLQDRSLFEKYKENQKHQKKLLARIKELERENQRLKTLPAKEQQKRKEILKKQFREATQGLTASELMDKALGLVENGKLTDLDKALEYLNKAISLDSNYTYAYVNRGAAWAVKGNYDRAVSDFNKAIELNPGYAIAYHNRGLTWANKGNYDRAVSDFNKAIELDPEFADAYGNRGVAWVKKGNYDRAISDYNKAIELNPEYVSTYYNLGNAWANKGNYDRAISDYNKAIELNQGYAEAYINRGLAWANKGNYDRAISDYNKAIELNQGYAEAYINRGLAWANKGNYDRAISDYNKAIELNPRYAEAYINRGLAWAIKGNYNQAISDYNKAIELNQGDALAYYGRGIAWEVKGNYDRAISDYNNYLKINGNKDGDADQVRQEIRNLGYTPKY